MTDSTTDFLTFIPTESRSKAAQEAIRVHVLRRRHQHRRESHRIRGKDLPAVAQHRGQFQIWQPDTASQQSGSPSSDSICQESPNPYVGLDLSIQDEGIECISPSSTDPSAELETAIDKGSALDRQSIEEILIKYYLLSGGSPIAHDWLRVYRQTTATFSAFLAMVATRLSNEQGRHPLLDPAELENQALEEVSRQISRSPGAPACSTILAVALLANLRQGEHLDCHWKGLLEMVRLHGGLRGLRAHGDLYAFLFWTEGVAMDGCPGSIGHLSPSHTEDTVPQGSIQDLQDLLEKINARLLEQVDHGGLPPSKLTSPVLGSLRRPSVTKARYVYDKWCRARLACLVYFAALSLEGKCRLQDNPQYRAVEAEVLNRERSYTVCPEELYYITVQVGNQDHTCELTWSVARLVHAVKELDDRDRNTCYRLLALYLGFQDPHVTAMVSTEWEELSDRLLSIPGETRDQNKEPSDPGESPCSLGRM